MVKDLEFIAGDIKINNGDFEITDSDQTHIEHILISSKGCFRNSPLTGVGIIKYLNGPGGSLVITSLKQKIQKQLEFDGYSNIRIKMTTLTDINVNAERI